MQHRKPAIVTPAVSILRKHRPDLAVRVVNVVDLMKLQAPSEHPHGLSDADFDALFTLDRPVIFAFHAYPALIHRLTYRRANHENFHVYGYREEGTINHYAVRYDGIERTRPVSRGEGRSKPGTAYLSSGRSAEA